MLRYVQHLRARGSAPRTIHNRLVYLRTFLRSHNLVLPLAKDDWPKYTEKVVSCYRADELRALLLLSTRRYLAYSPDVETIALHEHVTFDKQSRTMQHITQHMADRYRHAYHPVHAKSHGALVGALEVLPNLPERLTQGLFAKPGMHPVLMRFSTNPGGHAC